MTTTANCILPTVVNAAGNAHEYLIPLYPETDYALDVAKKPFAYDVPRVVAVYRLMHAGVYEYQGVRVFAPQRQQYEQDRALAALSACRELLAELYPELHPTETTRDAAIWQACARADAVLKAAAGEKDA